MRIPFVLVVAAILCLSVLPYAMSYLITHALTSSGMRSVYIRDVDFNPFSGTFVIEGLRMLNLQQQEIRVPKLEARFAWLPLLQKRLVVQHLLVQRAHVVLQKDEQGDYQLAGVPIPLMMAMAQGEASAWQIDIRRVSFGGTLALHLPWYQGEVSLDSLQISDISSMRSEKPFGISMIVHVSGATLMLDGEMNPFGEAVSAKGTLRVRRLSLADVQHLAAPWIPAEIATMQGRLDAQLPFTFSLQHEMAESLKLKGGSFTLHDMSMSMIHQDIRQVSADQVETADVSYDGNWHAGQGTLSHMRMHAVHGSGKLQQIYDVLMQSLRFSALDISELVHVRDTNIKQMHIESHSEGEMMRLETAHLAVRSLQAGKQIRLQGLSMDSLKLSLADGKTLSAEHLVSPDVSYDKALQAAEVVVKEPAWRDTSPARSIGRLTAAQLRTTDVQYRQDGHFDIAELELASPAGGMDRAQPWARDIAVSHVTGGGHLAIGSIQVKGSRIHLRRDQKHRWWLGDVPMSAFSGQSDQSLRLQRIGEVHLAGGELRLRDESVTPTYEDYFKLLTARIQQMDRARPTHFSPFHLELVGKGGVRISVKGRVQPFGTSLMLTSKASIHSFSLPSINPLLGETLGYIARTGQLDADVDLNIEQGRLHGESRLSLRQLEVVPFKGAEKKKGDTGLSMPLDTALDMIRNDEGDIQLLIPVSGDIRNPTFSYQDAINKALGTALQKAALGYIAQTLQPYGALVTVADLAWSAGKKMMVVKLDPLVYAAGSAQTDETRVLPYMEHLAGLMNRKTSLRLTLCGKATATDRQALQQAGKAAGEDALLALAKARAQHIRDMLMTRFALDSERLFLCQPEIDSADDAQPRLEMTLH